jgi:hypothetical protein
MARKRDAKGKFVKGSGRSGGIRWDSDTLSPGLAAFWPKVDLAIRGVMLYHEPQVESYMKTNAPWTDRTSNARNGLGAKAFADGYNHGIICFHSVPYGIWLEVANNGRYRIIVPTIINQGTEVMRTVSQVLARIS